MKAILIALILGLVLAYAGGATATFSHGMKTVQADRLEQATNY